ncbi:inositol-1-monophosphatase [Peptococcaceae bacterium CEB3]|nr:inositol-1-monophosphatase [Peptococcaceae bacterium CEB3]
MLEEEIYKSGELDSGSILLLVHAQQYAVMAGRWLAQKRSSLTEVQCQRKKYYVDLVTEFDLGCERMLTEWVESRFPEHLILAEEGTADRLVDLAKMTQEERYCWVIDPLDGTTNFVHGIPHFAVSIGIVKGGEPLVGVVYDPNRNELFSAVRGMGATVNDRKLVVSEERELRDSLINTGFSAQDLFGDNMVRPELSQMYKRCQSVRISGSSALDLAYLSAGRIDGFWHWRLAPWDIAAGVLFVQEAGGKVTDLEGQPFRFGRDVLVASNGSIHGELLGALKTSPGCGEV